MSKAYVIKIYFEHNVFNVKISKAFLTNNLMRIRFPTQKKRETFPNSYPNSIAVFNVAHFTCNRNIFI